MQKEDGIWLYRQVIKDEILGGGLQNGCLYTLAARPSMGKSALALANGDNTIYIGKKNVVFFSLEMSKEKIFSRLEETTDYEEYRLYHVRACFDLERFQLQLKSIRVDEMEEF